jgi:hypothetical protein
MMIPPTLYLAVAWIAGITVAGNLSPAEIEAPLLRSGVLSPPPSWRMPGAAAGAGRGRDQQDQDQHGQAERGRGRVLQQFQAQVGRG